MIEEISKKYRVVEMVNGDFRVQKLVNDKWVIRTDIFEFATAASALMAMTKCIKAEQELQDSQTVKRVI